MLQPISWLSLEWLDMIILRIDLLRPLNPFLNIAEKPSIQNLGSRRECKRASLFISSQNFTNYRNFREYIYFCLVWFSVEEGIIVFKQLPKSIGDLVCLIKGLTHHIGGLIHSFNISMEAEWILLKICWAPRIISQLQNF